MKYKIFLIVLFLSSLSFSQDIETLKKADTIYLLFEKKNNQHFFESYQDKLNFNYVTFHFFTHPPYGYTFFISEKKDEKRKKLSYREYKKLIKRNVNIYIPDFNSFAQNKDLSGLFSKNGIRKTIYIIDISNSKKIYMFKVRDVSAYFGDD